MDELFGLSRFVLTLLIFVPIERLFAARPQKIFRRGLLTDMAFQFLNGWLIIVGVIAIVTMAIVVNQSILPSVATSAAVCKSPIRPCSAIEGDAVRGLAGASWAGSGVVKTI